MMSNWFRSLSVAIGWMSLIGSPAAAQVVPDDTLGEESSRVNAIRIGNINLDRIDGGAVRGSNLFHSFEQFNVGEDRNVYFANPTGIDSIFSRVTGSDISNINGRLGVLGTADLYLMNPNGIVFGENAVLDVLGSFTATTANSIQFGDRGFFDTSNPNIPSSLLTIHPSAYLFNQPNAGAIVNRSINFNPALSFNLGLLVLPTESLTLLGGEIRLEGGSLTALSGQVEIGAVDGVGSVGVDASGRLSFPNTIDRAHVSVRNSSAISTVGSGGGTVRIYADDLTISQSVIDAGIRAGLGSETAQTGDVILDATGDIQIDRSIVFNDVNRNSTDGNGVGNSGDIVIRGNSLSVRDSALNSNTLGLGNSGSIRISIQDDFRLQNSVIRTGVGQTGVGQTGNIQITTGGQFELNQSIVGTNSRSAIFQAGTAIDFDQIANPSSVRINAGSLEINDSTIATAVAEFTNSREIPIGAASSIVIDVAEGIEIFDSNPDDVIQSGITSVVSPNAFGRGGNVSIDGRSLSILGGTIASASATGADEAYESLSRELAAALLRFPELGQSGNIRMRIRDRFEATDATVTAGGIILGGNIRISAGEIVLRGDTGISSFAGVRDAGGISLEADSILAFDNSNILAFSYIGRGGNIDLETPAFFAENYQFSSERLEDPSLNEQSSIDEIVRFISSGEYIAFRDQRDRALDNNRVDIDASGTISGGEIAIPDVSLVENSLVEIPATAIDTNALLTNSCIARTPNSGSFIITGSGNLPARPGDEFASPYPTGTVRSTLEVEQAIEPQGIYQLPDGRLVMSRECD